MCLNESNWYEGILQSVSLATAMDGNKWLLHQRRVIRELKLLFPFVASDVIGAKNQMEKKSLLN